MSNGVCHIPNGLLFLSLKVEEPLIDNSTDEYHGTEKWCRKCGGRPYRVRIWFCDKNYLHEHQGRRDCPDYGDERNMKNYLYEKKRGQDVLGDCEQVDWRICRSHRCVKN